MVNEVHPGKGSTAPQLLHPTNNEGLRQSIEGGGNANAGPSNNPNNPFTPKTKVNKKGKSKARESILTNHLRKCYDEGADFTYTAEDAKNDANYSDDIWEEVATMVNQRMEFEVQMGVAETDRQISEQEVQGLELALATYKTQYSDLEKEVKTLKLKIASLSTEKRVIEEEAAALDSSCANLQAYANRMKILLDAREDAARHGSPALSAAGAGGGRLSSKIPDPPPFSGDPKEDKLKFEHWKVRMKGKFQSNDDHFLSEQDKINYVVSRVEGAAAEHVNPRLDPGSSLAYVTAKDVLDHLAQVYENPFKKEDADAEYKSWKMTKDMSFHDFFSKFLLLSGTAEKPKSEQVQELKDKLYYELEKGVRDKFFENPTLEEFAKHCTRHDNALKKDFKERAEYRSKMAKVAEAGGKKTAPERATSASAPAGRGGYGGGGGNYRRRYDPSKDPNNMHKIPFICFNCGAEGHAARECPEPPKKSPIHAVNAIEESKKEAPVSEN